MTPRRGSDLQEGRPPSTKMLPLRGSLRVKRHRPGSQRITCQFVVHAIMLFFLTSSAPKAVNYAVELTMQPTYFEAPWGGYRQSGFGRELGPWSIEEYLQTKQVHINLSQQPIGWY